MPATGTYQDRRPHELQRHWIRVSKPYKQHAVAASRPPSRHSPPGARLSPSPARAPLGLGVLQPCRMAARPVAAAPSAGSARRSTSISQHSMGSRLQVPGMRTPMAPSAPPPGGRGGRRQAAVMGTAAASPTLQRARGQGGGGVGRVGSGKHDVRECEPGVRFRYTRASGATARYGTGDG